MKQTILLVFSLFIAFSASFAQKNKTTAATSSPAPTPPPSVDWKKEQISLTKKTYSRALKYGDAAEARHALYTLIELDSAGANYKDSLISLYFSSQAYVNTVLLGREMLAAEPKNERVLAMLSASEQTMGLLKESLEHYETLYGLSKSLNDLYQIATINFQLERMGECKKALEQLIFDPKSAEEKVYISYGQQGGQDVPIKAAAWNMRGYMAASAKDAATAKECYNKALESFPEFLLAKSNLETLDKPQPTGGK